MTFCEYLLLAVIIVKLRLILYCESTKRFTSIVKYDIIVYNLDIYLPYQAHIYRRQCERFRFRFDILRNY